MRVRPWAPPGPTATVTVSARLFRDMLAGRADGADAFADGRIEFMGAAMACDRLKRLLRILRQRRAAGGAGGLWSRLLAAFL